MSPLLPTSAKNSNSTARQGVAPILLAVFILWQVAYHIFMHATLGNEDAEEGDDGLEACLFKGWSQLPSEELPEQIPDESPAELDALLAVSEMGGEQAAIPTTANAVTPPSTPARGGLRGLSAPIGEVESQQKPAAFMAKKSQAKHEKIFSAQGLSEMQQKVDAKLQLQAQRHAEHRAMRALSATHSHAQTTMTTTHLTPWAENLMHELHDMQEHLKHLHKERRDHAAAFASVYNSSQMGKSAEPDSMTPWAHNLDDLTHDIQHHMEQRNKERAEHEAARKAAHDARIAAAHAEVAKSSPLLQEIQSLGASLCHDPQHWNSPHCSQFVHASVNSTSASHAAHKDSQSKAEAHIKLLEKHMEQLHKDQEHDDEDIRQQSVAFLRELCADPARKSYPACMHVSVTTTIPPSRQSSNLRSSSTAPALRERPGEYANALRWTRLTNEEVALRSARSHVGAPALSLDRKQLRGHHWISEIPKVACVTVLPQGKVTEALMQYFMDNYKLQSYEGSRELVLIYHSADKEAARIAQLHADGISVKAAAAQGNEAFPSATAYRYGAWLAKDSDLVARWDFEGFHHPSRLSMQVHAIALSKRPVSILPSVTAFDADGEHSVVSNAGYHHGSLVGDRAWMRKHWRPVLEEENALLHGLHSGDVAQVAMPELLSYHDASMLDIAYRM